MFFKGQGKPWSLTNRRPEKYRDTLNEFEVSCLYILISKCFVCVCCFLWIELKVWITTIEIISGAS